MFGPLVFEYRLTMEKTCHTVLVWAHEIDAVAVAGTGLSAMHNIDGAVAAWFALLPQKHGQGKPPWKAACLPSIQVTGSCESLYLVVSIIDSPGQMFAVPVA